ncbi:histone-like nucleoid-structuring protein Lsr2 [Streptomyces parvulus]|uniref:Lsr2 family protein n=1 Tax=Streptomyces parvulus TaxID=146923 RepID=A0A369UYW2_9ACTN|nr:histone-like nucleoid-structuring protein Lsr2 [Streptomyces parvulus]RDD85962.1 Lsr2 family protein [Streptomyces parvulus]
MATKAEPVGSDQAGKPGVQEVITNIPNVGEVKAYFQVSTVDDFDGKTTEDVQTLRLTVPQEKEQEVVATDENGEVLKNEDGSDKLTTEKVWAYPALEIDLGKASREKLLKALEPFVSKARESKTQPVATQTTFTVSKSTSPHDLNAIRSWAKNAGHEVADKGRIAAKVIEAYYTSTGKPNPEKG